MMYNGVYCIYKEMSLSNSKPLTVSAKTVFFLAIFIYNQLKYQLIFYFQKNFKKHFNSPYLSPFSLLLCHNSGKDKQKY